MVEDLAVEGRWSNVTECFSMSSNLSGTMLFPHARWSIFRPLWTMMITLASTSLCSSQFVNMLDLIEYRMHKGGMGCRKLSGHLSLEKRDQVCISWLTHCDARDMDISVSFKDSGLFFGSRAVIAGWIRDVPSLLALQQ